MASIPFREMIATAAALAGLVAAAVAGAGALEASARPPATETIAYSACTHYREADGEVSCLRTGLFRIQLDGSGRRLLALDANDPEWSPGGRRLAFAGRGGIWVARADGSGRRRVTSAPRRGLDDEPSWTPDGRRIVFHRRWERNEELDLTVDLYVLDLRTGRVERLTQTPDDWEFDPDWSPDGRHVVFSRGDGDGADDGLFLLNVSSGRTTRLARGALLATPRWSPRRTTDRLRRRLRNRRHRTGRTGRRTLVRQRSVSALSWSPDGSRIAYTRIVGERRQRSACSSSGATGAGAPGLFFAAATSRTGARLRTSALEA